MLGGMVLQHSMRGVKREDKLREKREDAELFQVVASCHFRLLAQWWMHWCHGDTIDTHSRENGKCHRLYFSVVFDSVRVLQQAQKRRFFCSNSVLAAGAARRNCRTCAVFYNYGRFSPLKNKIKFTSSMLTLSRSSLQQYSE